MTNEKSYMTEAVVFVSIHSSMGSEDFLKIQTYLLSHNTTKCVAGVDIIKGPFYFV